MNEVNETIRVIDVQIGYHRKQIKALDETKEAEIKYHENQINELNDAKLEIMDKYNIPYKEE